MASITTITQLSNWHPREQPSSAKFNTQLTNKINTMIANHVTINSALEVLLQGAASGAQQAKITFALTSAPTGWTRDASVGTDKLLRVGSNGGSTGGSWTISGQSTTTEAAHTHTASHQHNYAHIHTAVHTHNLNAHTHTLTHTHSITDALIQSSTSGSFPTTMGAFFSNTWSDYYSVARVGHYHWFRSAHGTSGSTDAAFPANSDTTGNGWSSPVTTNMGTVYTDTGSAANTGSSGSHSHALSHTGLWRPAYQNVLACKKD